MTRQFSYLLMKRKNRSALLACTLLMCASPLPVLAGAGHDHGAEAAGPEAAATGPQLPRFEAANDKFEVVGRVENGQLRLWLDEWASNAPVSGASVEVTVKARKAVATAGADGSYSVAFPEGAMAGDYPLVINVGGPQGAALLGATIKVSDAAAHADHSDGLPAWVIYGLGGIGAILLVSGGLYVLRTRRARAVAGTSFALVALSVIGSAPQDARAGAGHDHGAEAAGPAGAPASPDQAFRLTDGSIAAPKPMQRLIGLRTVVAGKADTSASMTLNGVVVADPNGSGVVQSQVGGRVTGNLPALGASVGRGQALATVTPGFDPSARTALITEQGQVAQDLALARQRAAQAATGAASGETAQIAEVEAELAAARARASGGATAETRAEIAAARARIARLDAVQGVVPERERVAARATLAALEARANAQQAEANAAVRALEGRRGAIGSRRGALVGEAQGQASALAARQRALGQSVNTSETLRAPVSGVISSVMVAQGQVVAPGQTLFSILDPDRLLIEARSTDASAGALGQLASARTTDGRELSLLRLGAGLALVDGAAPVRYAIDVSAGLRVGETVTVFAPTATPVNGIRIPRNALVRLSNGQTAVFVKDSAERYRPVPVSTTDLDGGSVLVTSGIENGARIVLAGASLLSQVR